MREGVELKTSRRLSGQRSRLKTSNE